MPQLLCLHGIKYARPGGVEVPWGFESSRVLPRKVETGKTRVMTSTRCCAERARGEVVGAKAVSKPRKAFSTILYTSRHPDDDNNHP